MASPRRTHANGANARRSTGPRTAAGKERSSRNALRHGLSAGEGRPSSAEVLALAARITPADRPELAGLARQLAEAELDLRRVRSARLALIRAALAEGEREPGASAATPGGAPISISAEEHVAGAFARLGPSLQRLERYEDHARSRRKAAIREITDPLVLAALSRIIQP
jgi:hypothetical protein